MKHIQLTETILYVENQNVSTAFYEKLFRQKADLNVPGMTEESARAMMHEHFPQLKRWRA